MAQGYFLIPFQLEYREMVPGYSIPRRFTDLTRDLDFTERDAEEVGVREPDLPYGGIVALIETETQGQLNRLGREHPKWQSITRTEAASLIALLPPRKPRRDPEDGLLKIDGELRPAKRTIDDIEANLSKKAQARRLERGVS